MTDNNLENRLDVNSEDDESFHGFPPEDSFQGSGRQAAQNVDSDAHVSNNSTDTNLAKLFQDMMVENRRRDALIERLVDKLTVQPAGPNTNVAVMLKNLTTIDGNSANAKQWIKSLTSAQLLHDLPDTYMLETARTRLVSGASYWYAVNEPEIQTWQQFVDRFNSTFVPKESFSTKWRKMVARTQHKGEGLSGYFHEKVKLCKELDLGIRELKEQVLIGLWSKQMCDAMFGIKHFSVDQLFHDLQEYSQLESERVSRIVEASHNRSITRGGTIPRRDADGANVQGPRDISRDASRQIPQRNERSATRTEQPTSSTYLPARNSEGKPLCFQSKKYGHTSKYCLQTRPNRSAMPREITRTAANPDTTQNNPGPSVNLNVIGEHADDSNFKYFQPAYVNGELVEAYVDFGSQCTLIKENTVKQLGLVLNPLDRSFKITGFGNGSVKPIAKTYAEIKIDQAKAYTELLVIPDEYQQVPLLIGQPFTEQNHIVVVKKDDQLRLFDNDLYKIELPALPKPAVNLFVKEKQVLPSNHVGFITVYTEDYSNENVFVDAQNYENKFIPRCIITLEHGEAAIPVYNLTAYAAKMDANIKLTKGEYCSEQVEQHLEVNTVVIDGAEDMNTDINWGINNTHHQATKTTPFRLLFNYEPRDIHGDCIQKILLEHQQEEDIENRRQEALEKIKEDQERQKRRYNAKRSKASVYEPGDLVMIRREASSTGESRKLMEKYKGPYIVTEKLPFDRYRIEDMPETQRTQKFYKSVVAVDCMKRFMAPQSEDDSDEEPEKPVEEKERRRKQ
nr:unnamed protein product [Callosobruchus analis]